MLSCAVIAFALGLYDVAVQSGSLVNNGAEDVFICHWQ